MNPAQTVYAHDYCIPDQDRARVADGRWHRTDARCVYCGNPGAQTPGGSMRRMLLPRDGWRAVAASGAGEED